MICDHDLMSKSQRINQKIRILNLLLIKYNNRSYQIKHNNATYKVRV